MAKTVEKLDKGLKGEITIPADKSISHRAIMFSSMAKGISTIENFSSGKDCRSTLEIFQQLGVDVFFDDEKTLRVISNGKLEPSQSSVYNCGNSGTTMRLLSGILAGQKFASKLTGDESLSRRPMQRIIEPLMLMGADIESEDGFAPLLIRGTQLHGIEYISELSSAQVKSCVLLAGLNATGATTYIEPHVSRNHTELMLDYMGADITAEGNSVTIWASELEPRDIKIVGDISSAAFFIVAGLIIEGSNFIIKNVGLNPTRTGIIDVVKRMGGDIEIIDEHIESGELVGNIRVKYTENLNGCKIDGEDIPRLIDELPVIAVLATQANGETVVKNAEDLRNKESDRISSLVNGLKSLGADIEEAADGFKIKGKKNLSGGVELDCHSDHRLAMSFYVAGLICKDAILINGFEWTNISFPEFEGLMQRLF